MNETNFLPGDILAVHTEGWLGQWIQAAQRRRHGKTAGCVRSHIAGVGAIDPVEIVEADYPVATLRDYADWWGYWATSPGFDVLHLRMPGLSHDERESIGIALEEGFVGMPYDVETLLSLGWTCWWWRFWHPYAAWHLRHMRRTPDSVTCSELAVRAYNTVVYDLLPDRWRRNPDAVDPAMIVDSGLWKVVE